MHAFKDSTRPVQPGDPRLCTRYAVGIMIEKTALLVVLRLGRPDKEETQAIHMMTPAQARELAMHFWDGAERADRAMNLAVQTPVGQCDTCHADGVALVVRDGSQYANCHACDAAARKGGA